MPDFDLVAERRTELGKAAMRRLRRAGRLPAVVYGTGDAPASITLGENELYKQMEHEGFFSRVLTLKVEGQAPEQTIVRALQRHPATSRVLHMDLLRVSATEKLTITVPLHFLGEDVAPGVEEGGIVEHMISDVEISCLPADLPEYIDIDVSGIELGGSVHMSEIVLPSGVELVALSEENDPMLLIITLPRAEVEEEAEAGEEAAEAVGEGEAEGEPEAGESAAESGDEASEEDAG